MRAGAIAASIIIIGGVAFALFHEREGAPTAAPASVARAPAAPSSIPIAEASERVSIEGDAEAERAAGELARHLVARASGSIAAERLRRDRDALASELESIASRDPRAGEAMALRIALERTLLERPELAPGAARALKSFGDRERAFAVARGLLVASRDPDVRGALVAASGSDRPDGQREAALVALASVPGPEAVRAARAAFDAPSPDVRAAATYALATRLGEVDDRDAVIAAARRTAFSPAEPARARAEALHLIASAPAAPGDDVALARAALADASNDDVALAAARLALERGEDRSTIARALAARGSPAATRAAEALAHGGRP